MPRYEIKIEPWSLELWDELRALAESHFEEVDGDVEPNRKFDIDEVLMKLIEDAGALRIFTARKSGELIGYYVWTVQLDVESKGLLIGMMGPWYVAPGHPRAAFDMFKFSREALASEDVQCLSLHHRVQGRGAHLGRFFERQGAKFTQKNYSLWIGRHAQ